MQYKSTSYEFSFTDDGKIEKANVNGKPLSEEDSLVMEEYFKEQERINEEAEKKMLEIQEKINSLYTELKDIRKVADDEIAILIQNKVKPVFEKYPPKKQLVSPKRRNVVMSLPSFWYF